MTQTAVPVRQGVGIVMLTAYSASEQCYYAVSPHFDIARDGATLGEAEEMFREAVTILLDGAVEDGTLDQLLLAHGFSRHVGGEATAWTPPRAPLYPDWLGPLRDELGKPEVEYFEASVPVAE